MSKFIRYAQTYLIFGLPFVVAASIWSGHVPSGGLPSEASFGIRALWEVLSWNLMLWFLVLILFLIVLVANPASREQTLRRIANLKDRDEREEYLTGKAARTSYISTLAFAMFLLFASVFKFSFSNLPEDKSVNGDRHIVSIGLSFDFFGSLEPENKDGQAIIEVRRLPFSNSTILLGLILWQLASFNLTMRKVSRED